jgi:hypothetical protein
VHLYVFTGFFAQMVILANSEVEAQEILKSEVRIVYRDYGPWDLEKVVDLDEPTLVAWFAE